MWPLLILPRLVGTPRTQGLRSTHFWAPKKAGYIFLEKDVVHVLQRARPSPACSKGFQNVHYFCLQNKHCSA